MLDLDAALLEHGLAQKLHVHIIAHVGHMPGLLRAEQTARSAYLKVAHGDLEARAELGKLADGLKALFRYLGENLVLTEREIGRGAARAASDAAADLVQLGKTHFVRVLDDEGVDVRDINAGFDDRRAHEHLNFTLCYVLHDGGEHILVHLPVRYADRDLVIEQLAYFYRGALDIFDAVVQVIHLSAALYLAADSVADNSPVVLHDEGLHGQAVLRRLVYRRHVADAGKRHVERARYRRCRQRENVHAAAHFLYVLLVPDAEALLLINDEKPESFEFDILLQKPVSADDKVALAGFQVLKRFLYLRRGAEAA